MNGQPTPSPGTFDLNIDCEEKTTKKNWDKCMVVELCKMVTDFNKIEASKIKKVSPSPSSPGAPGNDQYQKGLADFKQRFKDEVSKKNPDEKKVRCHFSTQCRYNKWNEGKPPPPRNPEPPGKGPNRLQPDHVHDAALGGPLGDLDGLKWVHGRVNGTHGACMRNQEYKPGDKVTASKCCDPAPEDDKPETPCSESK